jgi:hypothetical protein
VTLIILLGVVAVATTVQALALVGVLVALRRLEGRLREAERQLGALRPRLERLGRVIDNVADWTDAGASHPAWPPTSRARSGTSAIARLRHDARGRCARDTTLAVWGDESGNAYRHRPGQARRARHDRPPSGGARQPTPPCAGFALPQRSSSASPSWSWP